MVDKARGGDEGMARWRLSSREDEGKTVKAIRDQARTKQRQARAARDRLELQLDRHGHPRKPDRMATTRGKVAYIANKELIQVLSASRAYQVDDEHHVCNFFALDFFSVTCEHKSVPTCALPRSSSWLAEK